MAIGIPTFQLIRGGIILTPLINSCLPGWVCEPQEKQWWPGNETLNDPVVRCHCRMFVAHVASFP